VLPDCRSVVGTTRVAVTLEQCWHRMPGGTARAAVETTTSLLAHHPELDLIGVSARHRRLPAPPHRPPIPVRSLPLPRLALYEAWHRLRRPPVDRVTGPVDVIHATGLAVPPPSAPVVWTLHDLAWRRDPSSFTAWGVRFFEAALARAIEDADLVLCPTRATIEDAVAAGLDRERMRLVPLGVRPVAVSDEQRRSVRRRHGLEREYVLSVGTAEPRKNLGTLIEAFARMERTDVDLVMVGPAGWNENLGPRTDRLGDRVRTLGFVADDELAALYAGAAAFAYPSRWEGFGLPVLEAMVAGAPVVTSAATATAEVAGDAALLVDPIDADALSTALTELLEDTALSTRLVDAGRARAATFTWERTAALTAAAYAEVAR